MIIECSDLRHHQSLPTSGMLTLNTSSTFLHQNILSCFAVLAKGYAMYGSQTPNPFPSSIALKLSQYTVCASDNPIHAPSPNPKTNPFLSHPHSTSLPRNKPVSIRRPRVRPADPHLYTHISMMSETEFIFIFCPPFPIWRALILGRICRPTTPLPGLDACFWKNPWGESRAAIAEYGV